MNGFSVLHRWAPTVLACGAILGSASAFAESAPRDLPESFFPETSCFESSCGSTVLVDGDSLEAYEVVAIRRALEKADGNRKRAASMLKIGEATLYRKLKKYEL